MLNDRNIYILSFILSSVCVAGMLNNFDSVLILLIDLLWLVLWLSEGTKTKSKRVQLRNRFSIKYLALAVVLLISMAYLYFVDVNLNAQLEGIEYLAAVFPILLLCSIGIKKGEAS